MDGFVFVSDICEHFNASRAWVYKYLIPYVEKRRERHTVVDAWGDEVVRSYQMVRLADALAYFADNAQVEVYSVPSDTAPSDTGGYAAYHRPRRVHIRPTHYTVGYINGGGRLWSARDLAAKVCGLDVDDADEAATEYAYKYVYAHAWYVLTYGGKTWFIPRESDPEYVVAATVKFGTAAHEVEYVRGARESKALNDALNAPLG